MLSRHRAPHSVWWWQLCGCLPKRNEKAQVSLGNKSPRIASKIQHYIHGNPHCYAPLCLSLFTLHRWLVPLIPLAHSLCSAPNKTFTKLLLLHPPSLIPFEVQTWSISHTWAWQTVLSIFHQWEGADEKTCAVRHSCPITCNFDLDGPSGTRVVFQLEKKKTHSRFVLYQECILGHANLNLDTKTTAMTTLVLLLPLPLLLQHTYMFSDLMLKQKPKWQLSTFRFPWRSLHFPLIVEPFGITLNMMRSWERLLNLSQFMVSAQWNGKAVHYK